ncbi:hypothetical protein [Colwellia sp. E2M01]|uniref:Ig-like domain-containing protein n=1 Tax=Colwellia sp. E2M01 TaxID=2841561 RepID=UPI001C08AD4F|nr:hypothetical protein [Colwellia sp. E2M01]MBU2869379.1 hypothetical protein [Colwellia sp. E2M01]
MQLLRRLSFTMLLMSMMTLVACGGGDISGGESSDGTGDETEDGVTLTVTKSDGELSAVNDITITATVLAGETPVSNKTVTFSLAVDTMGVLDPSSATATTDASGMASIVVKVTDVSGSVNVIASYEDASDNISFESLGDGITVVEDELKAASIKLFASSQQLASSGAQAIDLFAIAKDANNNLLEDITINFSSDSGEIGKVEETDTDITGADGQVAKELSTLIDPSNRTITVTATSGNISDSLEVEVVGTYLTLTGSASLALGNAANYVVNVLDSDGNGIAKTDVTISALDTGASLTFPETITTDSNGQAIINITGTTGGANTISVSALNASVSKNVSVQSDSFLFTDFSHNGVDFVNPTNEPTVPDVSLAQTASVTLTWQRSGTAVVDGTPVTFTTTRGVLSADNAMTSGGEVNVTLTSTDAGKALVTMVGTDTVDNETIELTNELEFEFYADTADTITVQASPNSIGPNEQTSTVSVVVKDPSGNLVKNKKIKFVLEDVSGGSISPATAVTDSSGSASTIYTSNSTSAQNGVVITAVVEDTPTVSNSVELTVAERELFIALGTGNELEELDASSYVKEYTVIVSDANSNPVEGVEVTLSALPEQYRKGFWVPLYDGDEFIVWSAQGADKLESLMVDLLPTKECDNEDINFDGFLELGEDINSNRILDDGEDINFDGILDVGEDFNGDALLTPGNKASVPGSVTTDSDGRAIVRIVYAQSYGQWLDIKLVASSKVNGTESSTEAIFTLPVLASDVNNEDISPPSSGVGLRGPFGLLNDCSLNISDDPKQDGT